MKKIITLSILFCISTNHHHTFTMLGSIKKLSLGRRQCCTKSILALQNMNDEIKEQLLYNAQTKAMLKFQTKIGKDIIKSNNKTLKNIRKADKTGYPIEIYNVRQAHELFWQINDILLGNKEHKE